MRQSTLRALGQSPTFVLIDEPGLLLLMLLLLMMMMCLFLPSLSSQSVFFYFIFVNEDSRSRGWFCVCLFNQFLNSCENKCLPILVVM